MSGITTVIVSVILFLILITVHEFGHFIVAKSTGIKVNEFSIGMGPKLFQKQKGETIYSLRLLPIGGYCSMEGEGEDSDDPRAFMNVAPWRKFLTILAGPLMNILFAILIFSIAINFSTVNSTIVGEILEDSPAEKAGLVEGDEFLSIDGKDISSFEDVTNNINDSMGKEVEIHLLRDGEEINVNVKPEESEGRYVIGVMSKQIPYQGNFFQAIKDGFTTTINIFGLLFNFIGQLFTGNISLNSVSGPVGVVAAISTAAKSGIYSLLFFFAYISVNLAFFNLLPIPALDGSQLVYIIIEKLRGKPLKTETIAKINLFGLSFLLILIFIVSINDVLRIIR